MPTANYITAQELNFRVKRGDTFKAPIQVFNNGSDYDFTDYHALMQIKDNKSNDYPLITLTDDNNGGITLTNGSITITITSDYMDLEPADYYYDLQITYPTGEVKTWLQGNFSVTQDVSR